MTNLETLKLYQRWRTGDDERTFDEIGITGADIGEALSWAIRELDSPDWVQAGDNTLHGTIDYWQAEAEKMKGDMQWWFHEAERRLDENDALLDERDEALARIEDLKIACRLGMDMMIANDCDLPITFETMRDSMDRLPNQSLAHIKAQAVTEATERLAAENEALRAELKSTENLAIKQGEWLQSIVNLTKGEPGELERHSTHDVVESVEALRDKNAIIQCKAISDAMEYAIDQVGSDASADDCVDAMCEYLEQVSEGKFPTVGSTGNTWRSIKAQGAREALQRAMSKPGFSSAVVRVDELQAVIEKMEKGK